MRDVLILFLPLIVTVVRLARPEALRSVVAESLLVRLSYSISGIIIMSIARTPDAKGTRRVTGVNAVTH